MTSSGNGMQTRSPVVTTSWDDGVEPDLRVAERLAARGMTGTFYVANHGWDGQQISATSIRELRDMGMEIGGHTVNHPDLRRLPTVSALREIAENKDYLEDVLGESIRSFCYPFGHHNRSVSRLVGQAGYLMGRTNVSHRLARGADPLRQPVTWQMYPHSTVSYVRHAIRSFNVSGAIRRVRWARGGDELASLERMAGHMKPDTVVHLWGHAWEVERLAAWRELDEVLSRLADLPNVRFRDNLTAVLGEGHDDA